MNNASPNQNSSFSAANSSVGNQGTNNGIINQYIGQTMSLPRRQLSFAVDDLPAQYIARPNELEALIGHLLRNEAATPVALTAALRGAGGFGKTTLARAACHDQRVRKHFGDQIVWVTLGEQPGDLTARINDLIEQLTGVRPGFSEREPASQRLGELLAQQPPLLLVIDDVWRADDLAPFLRGKGQCTRLITTRNGTTLRNAAANEVAVDVMQQNEAFGLLGYGLVNPDPGVLKRLAERLGYWPLLLQLVNGVLRERLRNNQPLPKALDYVVRALDKRGLVAFDVGDSAARELAVARTIGVGLAELNKNQQDRYHELAVFPEDATIPVATVARLWAQTGGLDEFDSEELCEQLSQLSLLQRYDLATNTLGLHDVFRSYLEQQTRDHLVGLHNQLLDDFAIDVGAFITNDDAYFWQYGAYHYVQAGRHDKLAALLQNGSYLDHKIRRVGIADLLADFRRLAHDPAIARLFRALRQSAHILARSPDELSNQIRGRLGSTHDVAFLGSNQVLQLESATLQGPDTPLMVVLAGHTSWVSACAISADNSFAVSASWDTTLRVWDVASGSTRHMLQGHTDRVSACAISADSSFVLSASFDNTLRVWDVANGQQLGCWHADAPLTCVAVDPTGQRIVAGDRAGNVHFFGWWVGRVTE